MKSKLKPMLKTPDLNRIKYCIKQLIDIVNISNINCRFGADNLLRNPELILDDKEIL